MPVKIYKPTSPGRRNMSVSDFAEITREQKAARSHRGQAVRAMAEFLRTWKPA